jgi:hypothetical protein
MTEIVMVTGEMPAVAHELSWNFVSKMLFILS